jgi:hypothetical protein
MALRPYGRPPARPASVLALNGSRQAQLRPITTIVAPAAAGPTTTQIPREFVLQDLILIVTGTMTVTTAGAGALRAEQPLSVIRSLELGGSPFGTIKKGDAAAFFRLQHLLKGTPGFLTALGSVATADFAFHLDLDFELEGIEASRQDTLLRGRDYTSLDLIINWGDKNDLISGATTWAVSNLQAVLMCHEFRDGVSLNPPKPYKVHKCAQDEQPCATATSSFSFLLNGKHTLRGVLIKQFTRAAGVTNDTPVETIVNGVTLELDGDPRAKWIPYSALRGDNKTFFSVETLPTGYAFLDLMKGSRENEINVNRYTSPKLIFDVNTVADGYLKIYPVEVV